MIANPTPPPTGTPQEKLAPPSELTIKVAEALGWMRCERNGREVWYDPEGGHVLPHELKAEIDERIDRLIEEAGNPTPEDLLALKKLGDPFPVARPATDGREET